MLYHSAVLCALATTFSISIAVAQPPDAPTNITNPNQPPVELALLPMSLEEFLARNGGLTRLKLKMDNATADEIAAEIKKQTGFDTVPYAQWRGTGDKVPRFSVEAMGQPLWETVSGWNRGDTPLYLQRDWSKPGLLSLVPWGDTQAGRALTAGPFYLVMSYIHRSTTRSLNLDPKLDATTKLNLLDSLSPQITLQNDPRFFPVIALILTEVEGARDDRGRAIAPGQNHSDPQPPYDNFFITLSLKAPEADAKSLKSFKGVIRLATITKSEHWEIDLKATPKAEKTFKSETAEVTYHLDGVSEGAAGTVAKLRIARKIIGPKRVFKGRQLRAEGMQLGDINSTTRSIRFFNAAGELISGNGGNSRSEQNGDIQTLDVEININRDPNVKDSTPAKMIIDVPLEWREVRVPFEFKDLPLP